MSRRIPRAVCLRYEGERYGSSAGRVCQTHVDKSLIVFAKNPIEFRVRLQVINDLNRDKGFAFVDSGGAVDVGAIDQDQIIWPRMFCF